VSIVNDAFLLSHGPSTLQEQNVLHQRFAFLQLHRCVLHGLSAWQENLINWMSSPGIRATPSGTVTGYSVSVPSRRGQLCNVTSRSGGWGSSACRPAAEHEGYSVGKPRQLVVVKTTVEQNFSVEHFSVSRFLSSFSKGPTASLAIACKKCHRLFFRQLLSTAARAELDPPDQVHTFGFLAASDQSFCWYRGVMPLYHTLWEHGMTCLWVSTEALMSRKDILSIGDVISTLHLISPLLQ